MQHYGAPLLATIEVFQVRQGLAVEEDAAGRYLLVSKSWY
jgi:hypothetical protein